MARKPAGYHERNASPPAYCTISPNAPSTNETDGIRSGSSPAGTCKLYLVRKSHGCSQTMPAVASTLSLPSHSALITDRQAFRVLKAAQLEINVGVRVPGRRAVTVAFMMQRTFGSRCKRTRMSLARASALKASSASVRRNDLPRVEKAFQAAEASRARARVRTEILDSWSGSCSDQAAGVEQVSFDALGATMVSRWTA